MRILKVIPFEKGPFREELTYFSAKDIVEGSIVEIALRNKKILGLVTETGVAEELKGDLKDLDFNLRKVLEVKDNAVFRKEYFEAISITAKYYLAKRNDAYTAMIPSLLREEFDHLSKLVFHTSKKVAFRNSKNIRTEKLLLQTNFDDRISFYKTIIRSSFAEKKSLFIVLPSDSEVKEFEALLMRGVEQFTFAYSSTSAKTKKTKDSIAKMLTMEHPVLIVGTAPYLALPRHDIATIILEGESSPVYKMHTAPHFDLRTFVEIFATNISAKLILSDTLLRFETYARKELDDFTEISPLSFRITFESVVELLERSTERNKRKFSIFTEENIEAIRSSVEKKENIFVFSLRKGLATYTICRDCNDILTCDECSAPLVLHLSRDGSKRMFICNRCGVEKSPETKCTMCGSWNLFPLGIGLDTVNEELKKHFPKVKIHKLDKDEVDSAKDAKELIKKFEEEQGAILLGTQMALFYIKKKIPISFIASFDSLWSIPNFQMGEKIIQLIFNLLSKTTKKLVIISKNVNDPALIAIKNDNLLSYARGELEDRQALGYPPYKKFIKITHYGGKDETTYAKNYLKQTFVDYDVDIFSGFVAKQKDKYNTNALIRLDRKKWSLPMLTPSGTIDESLREKLAMLPSQFTVAIDPENLL